MAGNSSRRRRHVLERRGAPTKTTTSWGPSANNSTTDPVLTRSDVFGELAPAWAALGQLRRRHPEAMDVLAGSLARSAGNAEAAGTTDQRGLPRVASTSQPRHRVVPDAGRAAVSFSTLGGDLPTRKRQPTGTITVELQDLDGNPVLAGSGGVAVTLSSNSTGGSFANLNGLRLSGGQAFIPPGAATVTFDYFDTKPGSPTLTASAAGFASATQQETILPGPISDTPSTDIIVGRTLSAYFTADVENNQETITFTVYNQQAASITGVLLTDTLAPER